MVVKLRPTGRMLPAVDVFASHNMLKNLVDNDYCIKILFIFNIYYIFMSIVTYVDNIANAKQNIEGSRVLTTHKKNRLFGGVNDSDPKYWICSNT